MTPLLKGMYRVVQNTDTKVYFWGDNFGNSVVFVLLGNVATQ